MEGDQIDREGWSVYLKYTEFKAKIGPLDRKLRDLAETDEAADEYMNVVYSLCAAYERQSYVEGIKVGARLMMELMG